MKKKLLLGLLLIIGLFIITGCNSKVAGEENKSIVISDVDKGTRWEAITNYDITLEFENGKCVSENYRLEFVKETNAIVYGIQMEGQTYIEDYKQEGNVVTYKRTGINSDFNGQTYDAAYDNAKKLYSNATITKK